MFAGRAFSLFSAQPGAPGNEQEKMKNYKLKINGNDYSVDINEVEGQEIKLEVNGKP